MSQLLYMKAILTQIDLCQQFVELSISIRKMTKCSDKLIEWETITFDGSNAMVAYVSKTKS